jgi:cell division protein ZapE
MNETTALAGVTRTSQRARATGRFGKKRDDAPAPAMTLLARYHSLVDDGTLEPQQLQYQAVLKLQEIADRLEANEKKARSRLSGRILGFRRKHDLVPGLYLWGDVGRGKTWLMDAFFETVRIDNKLRLHFHRFMQMVHHELQTFSADVDPLKMIAAHMGKHYRLLCLDEFQVTDIGNTMLLRNLVEALYAEGVTLVTTSNREPDDLCQDWFQREQFQPAADLIRIHSTVMHLHSPVDYRFRNHALDDIFFTPHDERTQQRMVTRFRAIAEGEIEEQSELVVNKRPLVARMRAVNVVWFDFDTLCRGPRAASDYIELAREYPTVLLSDVPLLDEGLDSSARRFLNLVDELYDQRTRLIFSAQTTLENLYQGDTLAFEYQRVLSRLHEMQSTAYQQAR